MSIQPPDPELFANLVPIGALSAEHRQRLSATAVLEELPAGQVLFEEGAVDNDTVYVLSGDVILASKKTGTSRKVRGGDDKARYPLSSLKPRQFRATTATVAYILRVDSQLLDTLLTWDQVAGIEVTEFEGDESDVVWMRRLLESRALLRLPAAGIQALFVSFEEVPMKSGQIIIRQGDAGDFYYVIKQGRCRVVQKPAASQPMVALADLVEGDGFGEEALLSDRPRNATIAALTNGALMRLAKSDFVTLLKEPLIESVGDADMAALVQAGAGLIDVRLESEHRQACIKGSLNIPLVRLRQQVAALDRNRKYIVYCDTGRRSAAAAFLMSERGFDVVMLRDGINALHRASPAAA
jgi:CRP-like cAMP-binding protein